MKVITIRPGDTLYQLGREYGLTVDQLVAANGIDPHKYLVVGDSLIIPAPRRKDPTGGQRLRLPLY